MNNLWGDSLSSFWSAWIIVITLGTIALSVWILLANRRTDKTPDADGNIETTGHAADGIEEYDNPLPQWWFKLFILTVVFALGYLVLYPGLGNYAGILGWSQESQWEEEVADAEDRFTPIFAQYQEVPIPELARDGEAMQVAERIFLNNCAVCHGSNAQGGYGFPNLTDDDWLYGGEPENILTTLNNGRNGLMPSWQQLGENNIENLTQYVLSLSNLEHDEERAASGESTFLAACAACHTPSGTGNTALGAPNLTNDIWLYQAPGQSVADSIRQTLRNGRNGHMPAQAAYIGEERVHLVAAYVYSLRFND
ncbi:MAG TPA: cytochrome-c oxidase, cbb3-type subunit III [Halomonas sp.]|jgi:cytochrome c oxidase cbb3-type subunit 3|uniref:cytochrome-c oxidase, cbb3-type subunit III n=1 Tax=Halomonadaceae TaxID=28256 RepID=UPI0005CBD405|nr:MULTISPECIES: cytochrome-c oxidase, cbb3-type subunit III [Halomonas]KTG27342.1 cytochrome C oxidase Cbb3 [Idiomarina sp. H105]MEC7295800.1 cytochrome-c oxidase, cbb3-type subunit III [Pseudomonadota bacterium]OAF03418.1 cytochrome C oxidase Cbb3 [Idiomarina sp. WRN-38]KJD20024.1 cytochrome Cbb3 [Halomonas meridiana]MCC4289795.1 cytochrome-c oxidase, cbb3-type subunit III [Halomonas axialensis]|tara:strand:- start:1291 stop:2220 length:930 start_codon:yes stop_codon:yes gene_type:complete